VSLKPVASCNSNNNNNNNKLLNNLGNKIRLSSGEATETTFLFQHILVVIQRFNFASVKDGPDQ